MRLVPTVDEAEACEGEANDADEAADADLSADQCKDVAGDPLDEDDDDE